MKGGAMNQFFRITDRAAAHSAELSSQKEAVDQILSLMENGSPVNQILESCILPPEQTSALILQLITAGVISPVTAEASTEKKVLVVTDSASDLPVNLAKQLGIELVPLQIQFGENRFSDGVDINPATFYRLLSTSKEQPTTAPPRPEDFHKIFESAIGQQDILFIHLSSRMSKTGEIAAQTVRKYFNTYLRKRKESGKGNRFRIEIIDSQQVSMGTALLVIEAAECARKGWSLDKIQEHILKCRDHVRVNFMVDKLDYLAKGGRIGRGSAFLGNLFGLKPILGMTEGGVNARSRSLGGRFAQRKLIDAMKKELNPAEQNIRIGICHGAAPEKAEKLRILIGEIFPTLTCLISDFGPTVGAHTGPGAVGVAWLALPR